MNSYEHTSRDFLPLSVIRSACAGDTDAVEQVLQHYRGYINKLCTGILYDKHGQPQSGNVSFTTIMDKSSARRARVLSKERLNGLL